MSTPEYAGAALPSAVCSKGVVKHQHGAQERFMRTPAGPHKLTHILGTVLVTRTKESVDSASFTLDQHADAVPEHLEEAAKKLRACFLPRVVAKR
jgi:hypothetical protein